MYGAVRVIIIVLFIRSPNVDLNKRCLSFFSFFLFYQYTTLSRSHHSSRAEDGYQMYSGGSVVGDHRPKDLAHLSIIFTGAKKCEIWTKFLHQSTLSHPLSRTLTDCRAMMMRHRTAEVAQLLKFTYDQKFPPPVPHSMRNSNSSFDNTCLRRLHFETEQNI